jgi:predicted nuclease of predicted toxin-antitoxin system
VIDVGLEESKDEVIWNCAFREDAVVISKDEDFVFLANRPGDK